jgi:hypothetical protein
MLGMVGGGRGVFYQPYHPRLLVIFQIPDSLTEFLMMINGRGMGVGGGGWGGGGGGVGVGGGGQQVSSVGGIP